MKSKLSLPILAVALVWLPLAPAQDAKPEGTPVSLKIDLVAWGNDIPGLSIKANGRGEEVTALAFRYSKPLKYSGGNILEIYQDPNAQAEQSAKMERLARESMEANPELGPARRSPSPPPSAAAPSGPAEPKVVATATLPTNSQRVTVLLAPGMDGQFQCYVIDDDPSRLPFGRLRVHNMAPVPVALRFNDQPVKEMAAREAILVQPQKNNQVIYELAYKKDGQWKMQENNLVKVMPAEQAQMIILKSNASFFTSSDGSSSGFLQSVVLRRTREPEPTQP